MTTDVVSAFGLQDFLESHPPGSRVRVTIDPAPEVSGSGVLRPPRIFVHCESATCEGKRWFKCEDTVVRMAYGYGLMFLTYKCQNCERSFKKFAVNLSHITKEDAWTAYKYGEDPPFGPVTPAKAISLVGPDKDSFLKGRRCESQGLGIGAFSYYRRVIENQRNRIFDEMIRVLRSISPNDPVIEDLENAKNETQFTKSIEAIKHAIPQTLMINGQNPLLLLHSALSEGLHAKGDEECLQYAAAARKVLFELVEKMAQALKDDKELGEAIKLLAKAKSPTQAGGS